MPRGVSPRRPARTGRQEKVRPPKDASRRNAGQGNAPGGTSALASPPRAKSSGPGQGKPAAAASQAVKKAATPKLKAYNPIAPDRVAEILDRLNQLSPDVTCALTHASAWELVVATILSAQSTDVTVNRVTPELFRKYPTVQAFAALSPEQLEPDVRSTGFF